jgi:hypothetical protein
MTNSVKQSSTDINISDIIENSIIDWHPGNILKSYHTIVTNPRNYSDLTEHYSQMVNNPALYLGGSVYGILSWLIKPLKQNLV